MGATPEDTGVTGFDFFSSAFLRVYEFSTEFVDGFNDEGVCRAVSTSSPCSCLNLTTL